MPVGDDATYSMAQARRPRSPPRSRRSSRARREQGIPPHWNVYVTVDDVDAPPARSARPAARCSPGPFDVFDAGPHVGDRRPDRRGRCACGRPATSIGAEVVNEPGALTLGRPRHARPGGRAGVLRRAARLELRADERGAAVLGDLQRRALTGRHDGPARRACPSNWFPYFGVDGRRRDDRAGRGRRAASRSWARSTSPAAASR